MVYNSSMKPGDLKKWRKRNNYSQSQLAKVLGVAKLTVSRWERGDREVPSFLHLALACMEKRKEKPSTGRPPRVRR